MKHDDKKMKKRGSTLTQEEWDRFKFGEAFSNPEAAMRTSQFAERFKKDAAEEWDSVMRAYLTTYYDVKPPPRQIKPK